MGYGHTLGDRYYIASYLSDTELICVSNVSMSQRYQELYPLCVEQWVMRDMRSDILPALEILDVVSYSVIYASHSVPEMGLSD